MTELLLFVGIFAAPNLTLAFAIGFAGHPVLSIVAFVTVFGRRLVAIHNEIKRETAERETAERETPEPQVVERIVVKEKIKVQRVLVEVPRKFTREEASAVLGVTPKANRDAILAAHRELIARVHPDRGGTNYLAQQVNDARNVLLG